MSKFEFKVGDRVVVGPSNREGVLTKLPAGEPPSIGAEFFAIRYSDFSQYEDESDYHLVPIASDIRLSGTNTATDPNHYKFGDVEVRQISGHLTSFGGQALQYIARATRLDGNNKGDAIEDLKKSLRFIEWEIERLEAK